MISKIQSVLAPITQDLEGAITSGSNVRPDEIILKNFGSNTFVSINFRNGKKVEFPLHLHSDNHAGTLIIPEKFYKEAESETELRDLLSAVFENQRSLEVEIKAQGNTIIIKPIGEKNSFYITFVL